ncbi:MAG: sulfatase [Fuerstiella sp.]|nr:sulfatase [Fuerstiella sp.]
MRIHSPLILILFFAAISKLCASQVANADEQPANILMIAIDDQNDWIGCLGGHPQIQTPHIDALAKRGTLFLNAHCQSPLCNPSRTSLMTGCRPSTTGVYGLAPWFRDVVELQNMVTLPQHFAQHGWKTFSAGKIFHGGYGTKRIYHEFDVVGPPPEVGVRPATKLVNTPSNHSLVDWGEFPHRDEDKGDYVVASWVVDQLQKEQTKPFFLSAGFFLPHVPCYATKKWFDLYPEQMLQLPPFLRGDRDDTPRFSWYLHWELPEPRHDFLVSSGQWKNLVRSYMACTSFVDSQVGRILHALEKSPYARNTIIVLWSDHGWHLGEKRITGKNSLWDRSTRVPLIFAGPHIPEGGRCVEPVELLDIYPTLSDFFQLSSPGHLEGHSLVPQLRNPTCERTWPAITTHNHDNHGIRSRDWRFIQYADGTEELYDMHNDPDEWHNLASDDQYAGVIEQHRHWVPVSRGPASGSQQRILVRSADGTVTWENREIVPDEPVPELTN